MSVNRDYNVDFTSNDRLGPTIDALLQKFAALDAEVAKVKAQLAGYASGGGRSSAAMGRQVAQLSQNLAGLQQQLQATNAQLNMVPARADAASASVGRMTGTFLAIREVVRVLDAIGEGIRNAEEATAKLAEQNLKLRDSMRELANLKGHEGPDDEVAGEALLLGMASGMKPDEAVKFLEQFEGSIPAGRQKGNIAPGRPAADREKLEREMAREGAAFTARIGLAPQTGGDLSGVVSQYTKISKVEDFAGQLGAMAYGLNEGRGKVSDLARSELAAAAGSIGDGRTKDLAELGAFIGVASNVSKTAGSAGTRYTQASDVINTVGGEQEEYLKRAGIADASGDLEKLRKLKEDLDKNGGSDKAGYLYRQGFHNRVGVRSAITLANNLDVIEQRVSEARKRAANGGETIALDRAFLANDVTGQNRRAEAAQAGAEFVQGKEKESVVVARKYAEARLRAQNKIDTPETNAADAAADSNIFSRIDRMFGAPTAREKRIDAEVRRALDEEGKRVGVRVYGEYDQVNGNLPGGRETVEKYNQFAGQIAEKGGDPTGGMAPVVERLDRLISLEEQKQRQAQAPQPQGPQPPRGKGAAVPGRP